VKIITSTATLELLVKLTDDCFLVVIYPQYCHVLHLRNTIYWLPNILVKLDQLKRQNHWMSIVPLNLLVPKTTRTLVKQNKKAKICFVIHIAGEKKLLFYIYFVIVKQKFINGSLITTSTMIGGPFPLESSPIISWARACKAWLEDVVCLLTTASRRAGSSLRRAQLWGPTLDDEHQGVRDHHRKS
jgi:hypothetical protein